MITGTPLGAEPCRLPGRYHSLCCGNDRYIGPDAPSTLVLLSGLLHYIPLAGYYTGRGALGVVFAFEHFSITIQPLTFPLQAAGRAVVGRSAGEDDEAQGAAVDRTRRRCG